jgi:hypothetical protein
MYADLKHNFDSKCRACGGMRIVSTWWTDGTKVEFFFVATCVTCDAPDADEPFAE